MLALFSLSLLGLALRGVAASELHARGALDSLAARQVGGLDPSIFPAQCQQTCTPIITVFKTCTSISCLCTATNQANLEQCITCVISVASTPALRAQGQQVLDSFHTACTSGGVNLPPVTVGTATTAAPTAATATAAPAPLTAAGTTTPAAVVTATAGATGGGLANPGTSKTAPASQATDPFARNGAGRVAGGVGVAVLAFVVMVVIGLA